MTSYPARISLKDRGVIRPRAFADLTIFDPGSVNDRASLKAETRGRRDRDGDRQWPHRF